MYGKRCRCRKDKCGNRIQQIAFKNMHLKIAIKEYIMNQIEFVSEICQSVYSLFLGGNTAAFNICSDFEQ